MLTGRRRRADDAEIAATAAALLVGGAMVACGATIVRSSVGARWIGDVNLRDRLTAPADEVGGAAVAEGARW